MRFFGKTTCALAACLLALWVPAAHAAPAPADFYGVSSSGMLTSEAELLQIQSLGIHDVRVNFEWGRVDPSTTPCSVAGPTDWTHYDEVVGRAALHGITLIADLYGNRGTCGNGKGFPLPGTDNYAEYLGSGTDAQPGGFVWQAVRRYGAGGSFWAENPTIPPHPIEAWEVWNEPNLGENNPLGVVQPPLYARFLIDASATIHAVDPTATALVGGLYSGAGESPEDFFRAIYAYPWGYTPAQFHESFAGVGIHPYAITGRGANLTFGGPEVSEERLVEDRRVLDQPRPALGGGSDAEKTLWVTELGWPTEFASTPALAAITPEVQSAYISTALGWMYEHADEYRIEYAAAFVLNDYHEAVGCLEPRCWPQYAGLNRLEFAPGPLPLPVVRPAALAFQGLVAQPPPVAG